MVRVKNKTTGKLAASTITYGALETIEALAGIYQISVQAIVMKGIETYAEMDSIEVKSNSATPISHYFESGVAKISIQTADGELIETTVISTRANQISHVTEGRTYPSASNNPKSAC